MPGTGFYKLALTKPDGRDLLLYSRDPFTQEISAAGTLAGRETPAAGHLRWHPLRGEWVAFASHRQERTFLPPPEYNPLQPMYSPDIPTELPAGRYEVAAFENLFPSLARRSAAVPELGVPTAPARGRCEVIVFTQDPKSSLGRLSLSHLRLLLEVWADRYDEIGRTMNLGYVMPFENRGVEVGVTLHHPHGQLYAYQELPPMIATFARTQDDHWRSRGRNLIHDFVEREVREGERLVASSDSAVAFIPVCARYPYEIWVAPRRSVAFPGDLTEREKIDFARVLKTVLLKYDALWRRPFPYLMVLYAAPTDQRPHPEWHFHLQFFPPYRTSDRLKYLAGTELGAGLYVNDSLPEEKARELREIEVSID